MCRMRQVCRILQLSSDQVLVVRHTQVEGSGGERASLEDEVHTATPRAHRGRSGVGVPAPGRPGRQIPRHVDVGGTCAAGGTDAARAGRCPHPDACLDLAPSGCESGRSGLDGRTDSHRLSRRLVDDRTGTAHISRGGAGRRPVSEAPPPRLPTKLDGANEAHLIALVCTTPPEGRDRWTLRLLAERFVTLEGASVSYETVRRTLKKTFSSPG